MGKIQRIMNAAESRLIAGLGAMGLRLGPRKLLRVMARQYGETASLQAFAALLLLLKKWPPAQRPALLIPDDMHKALTFIKRHIGNPELIRLSESRGARTPNLFLLKKDYLFLACPYARRLKQPLAKHFENPVWLILSDGSLPDGEQYPLAALEAAGSDSLKTTVQGFGATVFSVRPGTNDYQIVAEVSDTYLPEIKKWLDSGRQGHRKRIIDLGGHIGSFSIQANALLSGNCDIHIYEPEPANFKQLKLNIEQNQAHNLTPFNLAVSSLAGQSTIAFNVENTGGHQLGRNGLSYAAKTIPVEVVTLQAVFSQWDELPVDILKIDVEGSEYDALFPAPELLKQCRLIVGEAQRSKEHVPQDMLDFLQNLGFSVTFSGDVRNCVTFSAVNGNL